MAAHCSADAMSRFGVKWSSTRTTLLLSKTFPAVRRPNSFIASGAVMSFASTRSTSISMNAPGFRLPRSRCPASICLVPLMSTPPPGASGAC